MYMNILLHSVASTSFSGAGITLAWILAGKIARLGNIITPLSQKRVIYSQHICLFVCFFICRDSQMLQKAFCNFYHLRYDFPGPVNIKKKKLLQSPSLKIQTSFTSCSLYFSRCFHPRAIRVVLPPPWPTPETRVYVQREQIESCVGVPAEPRLYYFIMWLLLCSLLVGRG